MKVRAGLPKSAHMMRCCGSRSCGWRLRRAASVCCMFSWHPESRMLPQALVNVLTMQRSQQQLVEIAAAVLLTMAAGSAEGCMLMLQAGFAAAAATLLHAAGSDTLHQRLAAAIQQIGQALPQAPVRSAHSGRPILLQI